MGGGSYYKRESSNEREYAVAKKENSGGFWGKLKNIGGSIWGGIKSAVGFGVKKAIKPVAKSLLTKAVRSAAKILASTNPALAIIVNNIDILVDKIAEALSNNTNSKLSYDRSNYDNVIDLEYTEEGYTNKSDDYEIREKLDQFIKEFLIGLESKELRDKVNAEIVSFVDIDKVLEIIKDMLKNIENNEHLEIVFRKLVKGMIRDFLKDKNKFDLINQSLKSHIRSIINKSGPEIAQYVKDIVDSWDAKDMSKTLELEVGKDLQWIRFNGMLVGGLIGFVIYISNDLIQKIM